MQESVCRERLLPECHAASKEARATRRQPHHLVLPQRALSNLQLRGVPRHSCMTIGPGYGRISLKGQTLLALASRSAHHQCRPHPPRHAKGPTAMSTSADGVTLSEEDKQQFLEVAVAAAREAGAAISAAWEGARSIQTKKGAMDLVTETDKQCEAIVQERLRTAFPSHAFIGEEGSAEQGFTAQLTDAPTWMVDPIDGTNNFVHRFPFTCVSIGLTVGRRPVVGVVFNPILDEMFHAVQGGGAFRNGSPIHVSDTPTLGGAVFATELGTSRDDASLDAIYGRMRALAKHTLSMRACGSCALNLCSVAMGRLDIYYEVGLGGPWDLAGAVVVLEEAGGRVSDPQGGPFNIMSHRVLGTNAYLSEATSAVLAAAPWGPDEPPALPLP